MLIFILLDVLRYYESTLSISLSNIESLVNSRLLLGYQLLNYVRC